MPRVEFMLTADERGPSEKWNIPSMPRVVSMVTAVERSPSGKANISSIKHNVSQKKCALLLRDQSGCEVANTACRLVPITYLSAVMCNQFSCTAASIPRLIGFLPIHNQVQPRLSCECPGANTRQPLTSAAGCCRRRRVHHHGHCHQV